MARSNPHGIRGLMRLSDGRWRVDLRWRDATGAYQRARETFPAGLTVTAAKARARELLSGALSGATRRPAPARTLGPSLNEYVAWRKANGRSRPQEDTARGARLAAA